MGVPLGVGETVTMGIVSAKGRATGLSDGAYEDFIQTDAAINPGNSGGALVNMRGELIGINSAIASESGGNQGIGFAIPSKMFSAVVENLLKSGKVVRGWMGVEILPITPAIAASMKLSSTRGAIVENVEPNSPADKAGIKRYDVVVGLNGQPVASAADLRNTIALMGPGKRVELRVLRDGREQTVALTLGELPSRLRTRSARPENIEPESLGIILSDISLSSRRRFNIPSSIGRGTVVSGIEQGSTAAQAGLLPGDVILEVNRREVTSAEMFLRQYQAARDPLLLLVYRSGKMVLCTLSK
jgi:S1-C subfamily serine protease